MELHFQVYGENGAPLIILHGLFGSLDNWAPVSRKLSAEFRVFALDLRNHGRSPHSPEMTLPLMASDVEAFMSARQLERAHLLGHSLGGKVAAHLALNARGRVDKLVVVDIAPRAYPLDHAPMIDALVALDLPRLQTRREVEDALAPRIPDLAVRRFLVKSIRHEPGRPLAWRMNLNAIARNYGRLAEALPRPRELFQGPALFIKGGNSDYIRAEDEVGIRELFPAAIFKVIAGAGHWVHAEAPEAFCREVLDFLC